MSKNIKNITEELMMRYVEGDLDLEESEKFQKILSQNEYLNNRVSILKSISDKQPLKSPPRRVHNKILSDIGLSNDTNISIIKRYIDSFMGAFENRPVLAGSFLSVFVIMALSAAIIYNSIGLAHDDKGHITDDPIEQEKEKDDNLEDDLST